jgi:hypothetical protein
MQLAKDHSQQQTVVLVMLNVRKSHNDGVTGITDGWTTEDLVFVWKNEEPVQVVKNLQLPPFKLETYRTDTCNSKTNTGTCKLPNLYILLYTK